MVTIFEIRNQRTQFHEDIISDLHPCEFGVLLYGGGKFQFRNLDDSNGLEFLILSLTNILPLEIAC